MFNLYLKKSFKPILFLTLTIFASCGKSLENSETSKKDVVYRPGLEDNSIIIESSYHSQGNSNSQKYQFQFNALVRIPPFIKVKEGNAANQWARIHFNQLNDNTEFYCDYQGGAYSDTPDNDWEIEKGLKYYFVGCYQDVDFDGAMDELNYYPGLESIQDQDHHIQLELLGSDPRYLTIGQAILEIEWH